MNTYFFIDLNYAYNGKYKRDQDLTQTLNGRDLKSKSWENEGNSIIAKRPRFTVFVIGISAV